MPTNFNAEEYAKPAEKPQHTPVPWQWKKSRTMQHLQDANGNALGISMPLPTNRNYDQTFRADMESRAAQVLTAINSHAALVEAVRSTLAAFDNDGHRGDKFFNGENSAIARCRAVLAQVDTQK